MICTILALPFGTDFYTSTTIIAKTFVALDELENVIGDNTQDIADQVALSEALTRFLYALPITQRRIFVRRYWYFESINEIASTFSISESKVKSMLMRLRKKLKQHLEQEGFEL